MDYNNLYEPKSKREQIEAVVRFVLDNDAQYTAANDMPTRLKIAAVKLFMERTSLGYHAFVVRSALRELQDTGSLNYDGEPYYF
jgi:hypothetical protein